MSMSKCNSPRHCCIRKVFVNFFHEQNTFRTNRASSNFLSCHSDLLETPFTTLSNAMSQCFLAWDNNSRIGQRTFLHCWCCLICRVGSGMLFFCFLLNLSPVQDHVTVAQWNQSWARHWICEVSVDLWGEIYNAPGRLFLKMYIIGFAVDHPDSRTVNDFDALATYHITQTYTYALCFQFCQSFSSLLFFRWRRRQLFCCSNAARRCPKQPLASGSYVTLLSLCTSAYLACDPSSGHSHVPAH